MHICQSEVFRMEGPLAEIRLQSVQLKLCLGRWYQRWNNRLLQQKQQQKPQSNIVGLHLQAFFFSLEMFKAYNKLFNILQIYLFLKGFEPSTASAFFAVICFQCKLYCQIDYKTCYGTEITTVYEAFKQMQWHSRTNHNWNT